MTELSLYMDDRQETIALSDEDGAKLYYGQLEKADDAQLQAAIREITQKLS